MTDPLPYSSGDRPDPLEIWIPTQQELREYSGSYPPLPESWQTHRVVFVRKAKLAWLFHRLDALMVPNRE